MRFKVDENLPLEVCELLRSDGHDAVTVHEQHLAGAEDVEIASVVRDEERALVTLDKGLGGIRLHPPAGYSGLIVLRLARQDVDAVVATWKRVVPMLRTESPAGELWVVDESGVRRRAG